MQGTIDRRAWRPLKPRATRRTPPVTDPVLEPFWSGLRVLAHFIAQPEGDQPPRLALVDEAGEDATRVAPAAAAALRDSIMALEAVVDGVLTIQPSLGDEGTALVGEAQVPGMSMILPRTPQVVYQRQLPAGAEDAEIAFVAVDLLSVDHQPLLDLPLLERKRHLENLFVESALVRVSPLARPPIGPWLSSWQAAGFAGLIMKAANSRYRPGEQTLEWVVVRRGLQRS
jgi:ATP-dependent DNA ligase